MQPGIDLKPRLLFVSPRFLFPVDSGGKIRTTQILRGLKGGAFAVTLAAPSNAQERERFAGDIAGVCDDFATWEAAPRGALKQLQRFRHLVSPYPIPVATDHSNAGERKVRELLDDVPDVVVFDFPHSAVLAPATIKVPAVMFTHNVEAEIFARHAEVATSALTRWLWKNQLGKMTRFERQTMARFDMVVAVSQRDADHLRAAYGARNVRVINTGVDLDFFSWASPPVGGEIMFSGSMDWLANQDGITYFMDEVWPHITRGRPDARMTVVGRTPPKLLVAKAQARGLNWRFTGYVDDIRDYIRAATVYVIPLRVGGGTRLKVFEAMGLGCPVVSTTVGVEGLPLEPGTHYLRADEPPAFADAVLKLLDDADLRLRLSQAARRHVEANFSFRSVAREFEKICLDTPALAAAKRT